MAPAELTVKEAALDAVSAFLTGCGLESFAETLRLEALKPGRLHGLGLDNLLHHAGTLATALTRLVDENAEASLRSPSAPHRKLSELSSDEAWLDLQLRRLAASPETLEQLPPELAKKLDQVVAAMPPGSGMSTVNGHTGRLQSGDSLAPNAATNQDGQEALPAPPAPPTPTASSQHYVPKRLAGPNDPFIDDLVEEYRDDNDPGYRIRDVVEIELLSEINEKYTEYLHGMHLAAAAAASTVAADHPNIDADANAVPVVLNESALAAAAVAHQPPLDSDVGANDGLPVEQPAPKQLPFEEQQQQSSEQSKPGSIKGFVKSAGSAMLAALGVGAKLSNSEQAQLDSAEQAELSGNGAPPSAPSSLAAAASAAVHLRDTETTTTLPEDSSAMASDAYLAAERLAEQLTQERLLTEQLAAVHLGASQEHMVNEQLVTTNSVAQLEAAQLAASQEQLIVDQFAAAQLGVSESVLIGSVPTCIPPGSLLPGGALPQPTIAPQSTDVVLSSQASAAAVAAPAMVGGYPVTQQGYTFVQPVAQQGYPVPHALVTKKERRRGDRPPCKYAKSGDPFYPAELDGVVFDSFALRVVYERDRTGFEEAKEFPIKMNSIVAARYQVIEYLGSAAFSRAVQCLDLHTNRMVCMKIIKNDKDFLDQSLDEIKLLKLINVNVDNIDDKHCLRLIDYFYHKEHLIIVTELLRDNLYEFSKFNRECGEEAYFTLGRLQRITRQVLMALEYIHSLWLIHSDLKPENILVKSYSRCEVKVIDFGSSCFVDDHLSSYVQSRSYRAPEVMLGLPYGQKIDIWSLGCIVAELWTGYVLFQNDSIQSLLARIMGIIGSFPTHMLSAGKHVPNYFTQDGRLYKEVEYPGEPERRIRIFLPKASSLRQRMRTHDAEFVDFLSQMLKLDPAERPTAVDALRHPWLAPGRYPDGIQSEQGLTSNKQDNV